MKITIDNIFTVGDMINALSLFPKNMEIAVFDKVVNCYYTRARLEAGQDFLGINESENISERKVKHIGNKCYYDAEQKGSYLCGNIDFGNTYIVH